MAMTDAVVEKNIKGLAQMLTDQQALIGKLEQRIKHLENNQQVMASEIANSKQMTAHIAGRGMGSTVHQG